jgi:hypothetical protein
MPSVARDGIALGHHQRCLCDGCGIERAVADDIAKARADAHRAAERSLLGLGVWITGWKRKPDGYLVAPAPVELAPAKVVFYWPAKDLLIAAKLERPYIVWIVRP